MITKINDFLWIDLSDIYLVDYDQLNKEMMIYINQHPKYPIILKNPVDMGVFNKEMSNYYQETKSRMKNNEKQTSATENEPQTSEDFMEFLNRKAKTRI